MLLSEREEEVLPMGGIYMEECAVFVQMTASHKTYRVKKNPLLLVCISMNNRKVFDVV